MDFTSLVTLFTQCMQCFSRIHYGRQFGASYESAVLKLNICSLRLYRWATSIGLNDDLKSHATPEGSLSKREILIAKHLLENIAEAFQTVEGLSRRYEETMRVIGEGENGNGVLTVINREKDEDEISARFKRMTLKVQDRIRDRQESTTAANKTEMTLYEKKRFEDLVRDIRDHTDALIESFPRTVMLQGQLAAKEVRDLAEDAQDRVLLKGIAQEHDRILAQALETAIIVQDGQEFKNVRVSGHSRAFLGNDVAYGVKVKGNTYSNLVIDGHAVVHAGNVYRGRGQNQIEFGHEKSRAVTDLRTSSSLVRRW